VELFWTPEALDDRRTIYEYIEADNPKAALALDELISEKARRLIEHPKIGRPGRVTGTRELVARHNYVLVYDISGNLVRLLRVLHTSKQWPPENERF
jgi:addiction module RelE/StbE family toxin